MSVVSQDLPESKNVDIMSLLRDFYNKVSNETQLTAWWTPTPYVD